jgi:conjugal transfer pilus assembly protein TraD
MNSYINHFRPIFEARAAVGWLIGLILLPLSGMPHAWVFAGFCALFLLARTYQVHKALAFRMSISTRWLTLIQIEVLLRTSARMKADLDAMYFGTGFEWTQRHCQIAHDILRMPSNEIPGLPKWLPVNVAKRIETAFAPPNSVPDTAPQGKSWIHGMEPDKIVVPLHYKALGGHTAVGGTTGAGKTKTYELIGTQVIHSPGKDVLIIVDPKNDKDFKKRVERESKRAGRKFLYWKQAAPSESIRLNPLENWSQPSEIASRVSQLMEEGPFRDFAFLFIDRAVKGELYVGDKPNLRSILNYAQSGINGLLDRCLRRFFPEAGMLDWEDEARGFLQRIAQKGGVDPLQGMVQLYVDNFAKKGPGHETIDGLVATFVHDREHYMRIIASALPLLQMLATARRARRATRISPSCAASSRARTRSSRCAMRRSRARNTTSGHRCRNPSRNSRRGKAQATSAVWSTSPAPTT